MTREEAVTRAKTQATNTDETCVADKDGRGNWFVRRITKTRRARKRLTAVDRRVNGKTQAYRFTRRAEDALDNRNARARLAKYELALFGEAPEKRVPIEGDHKIAVLSDLQIPFEDPEALDQALDVIETYNPDLVVLNGDVVDCYAESAFLKDFDKARAAIPQEHERVATLLDILKDRRVIWMGGNHEDRWRRILWGATGPMSQLLLREHQKASGRDLDLVDPVKSFEKLFRLDERHVQYYPYSHRLYFADGNLVMTHGKYVSRHSGWSAKRTFEWLGKSCIVGHTHRLGSYLHTGDGVQHGAWENGCLCQLEPEYADAPDWQQGFSLVRVEGPEFNVIQVPIIRRNGLPVAVYRGG